jgi:hypothetical protein
VGSTLQDLPVILLFTMIKKKAAEPAYIVELRESLVKHRNEIVLLLSRQGLQRCKWPCDV